MAKKKNGGFSHEPHYEGLSNDWITPKHIIAAFDEYAYQRWGYGCMFDLDPCASINQPWPCARKAYTVEQDGLKHSWFDNVYLNPEYGPHTSKWVRRLIEHGQGIALIFARTDTKLWQDEIFPSADGFLFVRGRIKFHLPDGSLHKGGNAGAPSCLIAWGDNNREALIQITEDGTIPGAFCDRAFYTGSFAIAPKQAQLFPFAAAQHPRAGDGKNARA